MDSIRKNSIQFFLYIINFYYLTIFIFRHSIKSDVWDQYSIEHCAAPCSNESFIQLITIAEAIHNWMVVTKTDPYEVVQYRDACKGPYCNSKCPEEVALGLLAPYWSIHYQILILLAVVVIHVASIAVKLWIIVRNIKIKRQYRRYLREKKIHCITGVSS